jgi:hypothetical protein
MNLKVVNEFFRKIIINYLLIIIFTRRTINKSQKIYKKINKKYVRE